MWFEERKIRITGSNCYNFYTYMKNNHIKEEWDKKLNDTYKSKFGGNRYTFKGKKT